MESEHPKLCMEIVNMFNSVCKVKHLKQCMEIVKILNSVWKVKYLNSERKV